MATNNYLITGYWGEPHVTAENDRGINAGLFGTGRFVLPVGERFKAEYIGNNTIRIYDGKLMNNGAAGGIPVGEYVDLLITNANQGMKRNDLIVFQYEQDTSTLVERGTFVVVQGTESSGTAADPELTQQDLLSGEAVFDQMALWRVSVSGATISAPVQVFDLAPTIGEAKEAADTAKSIANAAQTTADAATALAEDEVGKWHTVDIIPFNRSAVQEFTNADDSKISKPLPVPMDFAKYNYEFQIIVFGLNSVGASSATVSVGDILLVRNGNSELVDLLSNTVDPTKESLSYPTPNKCEGFLTNESGAYTKYGRVSGENVAPFGSFSALAFAGEGEPFTDVRISWKNRTITKQTYGVRFQYRAMEKE